MLVKINKKDFVYNNPPLNLSFTVILTHAFSKYCHSLSPDKHHKMSHDSGNNVRKEEVGFSGNFYNGALRWFTGQIIINELRSPLINHAADGAMAKRTISF